MDMTDSERLEEVNKFGGPLFSKYNTSVQTRYPCYGKGRWGRFQYFWDSSKFKGDVLNIAVGPDNMDQPLIRYKKYYLREMWDDFGFVYLAFKEGR